jgi:hypothetical protein
MEVMKSILDKKSTPLYSVKYSPRSLSQKKKMSFF